MKIKFVEIQNFRKLKSVRIDFSNETTILVGANNSGKTSATVALQYFLTDSAKLKVSDFTISNWQKINGIGEKIEQALSSENTPRPEISDWVSVLPTFDLWLQVENNEIHRVLKILPSLSWNGGLLGVRFRFEPKDLEPFYGNFFDAKTSASEAIKKAKTNNDFKLWPKNLYEFLDTKLQSHFTLKSYVLDPRKIEDPDENGIANLQALDVSHNTIEGNALEGIIKINKISAFRGFSDAGDENQEGENTPQSKSKLSSQFRRYYNQILDPTDLPDASDIGALQAIHRAQESFDLRLQEGFRSPFEELSTLGYPGITDPDISISTKINPMDGLNHPSAISYGLGKDDSLPALPENYNGLGYQNLIYMVFEIMRFRDEFMRVGKLEKKYHSEGERKEQPAIHFLIIEEPEAHLHVQVQQVFIRKAYEVLTNHPDLKPGSSKTGKEQDQNKGKQKPMAQLPAISSQIVVSTHSSRIAHEVDFAHLRYFRRLPSEELRPIPVTSIVNLKKVFGDQDNTSKFVARYLRSVHCELFFADGIIFVEGTAERMLLPHFLQKEKFQNLNQSYISILGIGGSHAHRLKSLIECLGIPTLIITDLDAKNSKGEKAVPSRSSGQTTRNYTLKSWIPGLEKLDLLMDVSSGNLAKSYDDQYFAIRVAFQQEISIHFQADSNAEKVIPSTFEDALILENLQVLKKMWNESQTTDEEPTVELQRRMKSVCKLIAETADLQKLKNELFKEIDKKGFKGEFALDILFGIDPGDIAVPSYIEAGLSWLQEQVVKKRDEIASNK